MSLTAPALNATHQTYTVPRGPVQDLRALIWLKSRELLGETRDNSRLLFYAAAYVLWWVLVLAACWRAVHNGQIQTRYITNVVAGAWPLWALVPLLGGGAGEVMAATRLAAFPVSPRAVFGAGWVTALLDVPYVVVLPLVVGLETAAYGLPGLVATIAFTAGSMGIGQLAAWTSALLLAGRQRSGATALLLTGAVVGLIAAGPEVLGSAQRVAALLPSGWLASGNLAEVDGQWLHWFLWTALLLAPAALAVRLGPRLAAVTRDREARAGGAGARSWGDVSWSVRGSLSRALALADLRSMTRAVGAQVALAGVLAVPALARMPGVDIAEVSLPAMGTVSAIAAATVLGLNAFAFQAGGASMLLALPVTPRQVLCAKAFSIGGCLLMAQVAVTFAGALALPVGPSDVSEALVVSVARTLLLTGLSLVWSVRFPATTDYDSLRARIAAPRSVVTFGLVGALGCYAISQMAHDLRRPWGGPAAALLVTAVALLAGLCAARIAQADLSRGGTERVAAGVAG